MLLEVPRQLVICTCVSRILFGCVVLERQKLTEICSEGCSDPTRTVRNVTLLYLKFNHPSKLEYLLRSRWLQFERKLPETWSFQQINDQRPAEELFLALMFLLSKLAYAVCTIPYADVKKMIHLSLLPVIIVRINTLQTGRLQLW